MGRGKVGGEEAPRLSAQHGFAVLEEDLGDLGGLAAASGPENKRDSIHLDRRENLLLSCFHRQVHVDPIPVRVAEAACLLVVAPIWQPEKE